MNAPSRNYTTTVAGNSLWNVAHYLATGIIGTVVSILTARYLGSSAYGVLSYVVWLTAVIGTFTDFGLDQVIRRYVPAWFPQAATRARGLRVVVTAIGIQLAVGALLVGALALLIPSWSRALTITHPKLEVIVTIGLVSVLPAAVSRCVSSFLRSIQSTRVLAVIGVATQVVNLGLIAIAVGAGLDLVAFVTISLVTQTLLAAALVAVLRRYHGAPGPQPVPWPVREVTVYASIAYAQVILQQIVWSRSETFFLGLYSPSREIGFYGLAFSIAGLIGGAVGVLQQALFAAQFETLAANQEERSDRMASVSVKYLALLFLPIFLVAWLYIDSAVALLYGPAYETVAWVFPYLLLGAIVSNVLNPLVTKTNLSNRKFAATLGIALLGAALNIVLDLALIPSHHARGAGVANCLSQLSVVAVSMVFVAKVSPVSLRLRPIVGVALVNALLAAGVWFVLHRANVMPLKVLLTVVAGAAYLRWLAAWGVFDRTDMALLATLHADAPRWLRPLIALVRRSLEGAVAA